MYENIFNSGTKYMSEICTIVLITIVSNFISTNYKSHKYIVIIRMELCIILQTVVTYIICYQCFGRLNL